MNSALHEEEYEISSHIMRYYKYLDSRSIWIPLVGEKLTSRMEPENALHKSAIALMEISSVIRHLMKGETSKLGEAIFIQFFIHSCCNRKVS